MKLLEVLFFLAALSPAAFASTENGVKDQEEVLSPSLYQNQGDAQAKYELNLSFVKFAHLDWTREQIITQLNHLAKIYRQCEIRVGVAKIHTINSIEAPTKISFTQPRLPLYGYESIAENISIQERPLVFLINGMLEGEHESSFAVAKWTIFPELKVAPAVNNTVWLIHAINSQEYDERLHPQCANCTLAHELAHVLMRDGMHNGDRPPNLMSGAKMGGRTNALPPHLCKEILANELIRRVGH